MGNVGRQSLGALIAALSAFVLVLSGCAQLGASPESSAAASAADIASPPLASTSTASAPASGRTADSATAAAEQDGLKLTVSPSATSIAAGGPLRFTITVLNERQTPVVYSVSTCFVSLDLGLPMRLEPVGRSDWPGAEESFKAYALAHGSGQGDPVPGVLPVELLRGTGCVERESEASLDPAASLTATFDWAADYLAGLPVSGGQIGYRVSFAYDRQNGPPSYAPDYTGIRGSWFPIYKQLTVHGDVAVAPPDKLIITPGQAIDGALANARFATFVTTNADAGCTANVYLDGGEQKYLPPDSAWLIETFCDNPRRFIRISIDPWTAAVTGIDSCPDPCGR